MAQFTLLDQAAEDKLHSTRLLNIEERPFKRITKRLLASSTPISSYLTRTSTNPPPPRKFRSQTSSSTRDEVSSETEATTAGPTQQQQQQPPPPPPTTITPEQQEKFLRDLQRFREDVILDFAAFDSSIARIQFLHLANAKQRARYADEKISIQTTSDEVRLDMDRLKVRLEEAQNLLQVRKGYDVLAETITRNKDLKARDEQQVNIERLRTEIEELEREGVELGNAWVERREQFVRVVDEGARLRRVVRGEPEPDVKGEEGDADAGDEDDGGGGDDEDEDEENGGKKREEEVRSDIHDHENDHDEEERERRGDGGGGGGGDGGMDEDGRDENMLGYEEGRRGGGHGSNIGTPLMRPSRDRDGDDPPTPLPGVHESGAMTPRSILGEAEVSTPRIEISVTADGDNVEMGKSGDKMDET